MSRFAAACPPSCLLRDVFLVLLFGKAVPVPPFAGSEGSLRRTAPLLSVMPTEVGIQVTAARGCGGEDGTPGRNLDPHPC